MKKILICGSLAVLTLTSFKKEATSITSKLVPAIAANAAGEPINTNIRIDVAGLTFHNGCTDEDMLITSGTFFMTTHQDGSVSTFNVHDFVLQAADGSIYRGIWVGTWQVTAPLPDPGALTNTYKVIFTTSGGGNNFLLQGVFHVTENANGEFAVEIDNFTAGCQ